MSIKRQFAHAVLAANPDAARDVRVARSLGLPVEKFARLSEAEQRLQIAYDRVTMT